MAQPTRNRGGRPPLAIQRQRSHAVRVRFTAADARCDVAPPSAVAPSPSSSARTSPACSTPSRGELRRVGRLLNDAVRAIHAARRHPDRETLDALRRAADAVAHQLGRWP